MVNKTIVNNNKPPLFPSLEEGTGVVSSPSLEEETGVVSSSLLWRGAGGKVKNNNLTGYRKTC
ncbi:MAG: hypothetical protein LBC68_12000 [Prevotellaceae bacterium]|jgi:hypothetical protein|nr:hypothetical protein [Prevotellaceae bacterium]